VGETLFAGNRGNGATWKFSLAMTGDYDCHVFASPVTEGNPWRSKMVTITFPNMSDMAANLEAALARKRLLRAVVAAILSTLPAFLVDAEIAYGSGQYLFRPD
jgi:hypothetical protein